MWAVSKRAPVAVFFAFPSKLTPHGIPKALINLSVSVDTKDLDDWQEDQQIVLRLRLSASVYLVFRPALVATISKSNATEIGNVKPQHHTPECSPHGTKGATVSFEQSEISKNDTHN